jgi:hypothetical protein
MFLSPPPRLRETFSQHTGRCKKKTTSLISSPRPARLLPNSTHPMRALSIVVILFFTSTLHAQTKGSFHETSSCGTSSVHQTVTINDDRQHSISLDQRPCHSKQPIRLGDLTSSDYIAYGVDDVQKNASIDRGYVVGTMNNGDRYFLSYEGTATMNGNIPEHLAGKWKFTGGTGKLKELQGGGKYTAHPTANGGMEFEINGDYQVP